MNLDPFGHNAVTRHFMGAARRELAAAKTPAVKQFWADVIAKDEQRIKEREEAEIDFWKTLSTDRGYS